MKKRSYLALVPLLLVILPNALVAQGGSAPVILAVVVNYHGDPSQIAISGRNFKPSGTPPTVLFGDVPLTSILSVSDTSVVASLPPNPPTGSYLLTVTNSKKVSGTAYITIGAAGPPGAGFDKPVNLTVDCNAGGSVGNTLGNAGTRVARTTINIIGFCNENVNIEWSNITLRRADNSPDGAGFNNLSLSLGAQGIRIENLRIARGLTAAEGASFRAENLRIDQPDRISVALSSSASGLLINPTITNCGDVEVQAGAYLYINGGTLSGTSSCTAGGVSVSNGGSIDIMGTVIRGFSGPGLGVGLGGSAYADGAIIENGSGPGIYAKGSVSLFSTTISGNAGGGIWVDTGGILDTRSGTKILENGEAGIDVRPGGIAHINDSEISHNGRGIFAIAGALNVQGSHISYNNGWGIAARSTSTLSISNSWVEGNQGDGIWLEDLTFMEAGGEAIHINNNRGVALHCPPGPIGQQYTDYAPINMTGNSGAIVGCNAAPK